MDKKLINRLAVTIEKINYLYRNIRKREENMQKLELALLKKYVTELYDGLVEVELSLKQDTLPEQIMQHPLQQREQLVKEKVQELVQPEPIAQPEPEPEPVVIPEPEPEPEVEPEPEPVVVMEEVMHQTEEDIEDLVPTGQIDQSYAEEISNVISTDNSNIDEEVVVDDDGSVKTQILTNLQKADLLKQDDNDEDETVAMELNDVLGNKKEQTIADKFAVKSGATEFAIGHNQRIEYINHLFGGDDEAYNTAIDDLANAQGYIEALTYVNLNLRYDYKWDDKDPKVREFLDMIKHKFLEGYYS